MQECKKKQSKAANNKTPWDKHSVLRSYENTDVNVFPCHKHSQSGTYPETKTSGYIAGWSAKVKLSNIDITDDGGFSLTEHFHWQHQTFETFISNIPWNLLRGQCLRRTHICRSINKAVLLGAVPKNCSAAMKVEGPTVTPAARCERAPLWSCLSSWDHNIMFELWFQRTAPDRRGRACRAAADGHLRGSASSSPLRRRQRHHKGQRRSGLSPTSAAHSSKCWVRVLLQTSIYDSYFCSVGFPLTDPQRQILCINSARKNPAKLSSSGENLDVWRKQTQPSPAATHFSFGGNQMENWIQRALQLPHPRKALWKIFMFYLLIHPFHRHQIILLELWNSPRRHIVAAFREINIQQAGGEKVNGEKEGWGGGGVL